MKHIILLGDGMADHAIQRLNGLTPLAYAQTPYMDLLAREGRTGRLITVPEGFPPGSEVANTAILGYDLNEVYEGRGPLEAASIGYEMRPDDMAIRCNIITLADGKIKNHHGGHLTTAEGDVLVKFLDQHLGNDRIRFITGIQYRHLLVIRGGNKHIVCSPPHDHPDEAWQPLLVKPEEGHDNCQEPGRMTAQETADLINNLIIRSQQLLAEHPFNLQRKADGKQPANSIWPWSPGRVWTIKDNYRLGDDIQSKVLAFAFGLSAEIERNLISQRTKEALARKKAEGVVLGRPKGRKTSPEKHKLHKKEYLISELLANGMSQRKIAKLFKVDRNTLSRFIQLNHLAAN